MDTIGNDFGDMRLVLVLKHEDFLRQGRDLGGSCAFNSPISNVELVV